MKLPDAREGRTVPHASPLEGYASSSIFFDHRIELVTANKISTEIFAALEAYSEVKEAGLLFFKQHTGKSDSDCERLHFEFQSFIRQAKTFYTSSEELHHRASPLFAYYAFMNLAKALICRTDPDVILENQKLYHGLVPVHFDSDFAKEVVDVDNGVFHLFYKAATGKVLPVGSGRGTTRKLGFPLHIAEMFPYVSELSFDYYRATSDNSRKARGKSVLISSVAGMQTRLLLAIGEFEAMKKSPDAFALFLKVFEEVDVSKEHSEKVFGFTATQRLMHSFFQTKYLISQTDPAGETGFDAFREQLNGVRLQYFLNEPNHSPYHFIVSTPLGDKFEYPWNEFCAGYVLYFYLGNLVRYQPRYLESLLAKRESWLIEQFSTSGRLNLLRHFVNAVLKRNFVFQSH